MNDLDKLLVKLDKILSILEPPTAMEAYMEDEEDTKELGNLQLKIHNLIANLERLGDSIKVNNPGPMSYDTGVFWGYQYVIGILKEFVK